MDGSWFVNFGKLRASFSLFEARWSATFVLGDWGWGSSGCLPRYTERRWRGMGGRDEGDYWYCVREE